VAVHYGCGVYLGLDVGKEGHHAVGLAPDGKRLHDAALPNTETRLRQLFDKLARHGRDLVVVDQPAPSDALPSKAAGPRHTTSSASWSTPLQVARRHTRGQHRRRVGRRVREVRRWSLVHPTSDTRPRPATTIGSRILRARYGTCRGGWNW
jgi:hypothetical protein